MRRTFASIALAVAALGTLGNSPRGPEFYNLLDEGVPANETLVVPASGELARTYTFIATLEGEEFAEGHGLFDVIAELDSVGADGAAPVGPFLGVQIVREDGEILLERDVGATTTLEPVMATDGTCAPGCAITFDLVLANSETQDVEVEVAMFPRGQVPIEAEMRSVVRIEPDQ